MNAHSHHPPTVRTTCPYCGVGCGLLATPDGRGGAAIAGDPDHPANFGRAFGADTVPGTYQDLDEADLIILVGSNAAWCHPVLFQRMVKNRRERGAKVVVIDPRRTVTAEDADLFLPIAPGTDTALFCGLL